MSISSDAVRELREATGVGIMDCKRALEKSEGDFDEAKKILREEGKSEMGKLSTRTAAEGRIESYIHHNGKIGVLVEVNCETDFTAANDEFRQFVSSLAKHIAAASPPPRYVNPEDVPDHDLEEERSVLQAQAEKEDKPPEIVEKIVEGRMSKFYEENCLMKQPFILDPEGEMTVEDALADLTAQVGEKVVVNRFARFVIGEDET
ncbi:MAG: translation elongation factor Ts [Candidatus Bipolaricaulia bacterium]